MTIAKISSKAIRNKLPKEIYFLLFIYLLSLVIFSIFRFILIFVNLDKLIEIPKSAWLNSFLYMGIRYDNVISAQILALPALLFIITYLFKWRTFHLMKLSTIYLSILFTFSFGLCATDIPYFNYTNSRITFNIFSWVDDLPTMFSVMVSNWINVIAIVLFILISLLFNFFVWKRLKTLQNQVNEIKQKLPGRIFLSVIFIFVFTIGLRGRFQFNSHPLVIRDAFRSEFNIADQISMNGAHHFISNLGKTRKNLLETEVALKTCSRYLYSDKQNGESISRKIHFDEPEKKANVIIVLMESMSFEKVGWYHPERKSLTRNIDSLISNSLFFPNTYSAGMNTSSGIYSTLFSLPHFGNIKPTLSSQITSASLAGIPNVLKRKGYQNLYFCNGNLEFDNAKSFLKQNDFNHLTGSESYDPEKIISIWGVSDLTLLKHSLKYLDGVDKKSEPFLAVYNTISTHPPYDVPTNEAFHPTCESKIDQSYEYADWAIGQFIKEAKTKNWFENTLFVFIADHGQKFNVTYEMPLSYNHIPLIFYYPGKLEPRTDDRLAMQMDVFPTIMDILKIPFVNNTFGIDLMTQKRPYAYFYSNNKFGCINQDYYMIYKFNHSYLYNYKEKNTTNIANKQKEVVEDMQQYLFSMIQTTNYMLDNQLTGLDKN